MEIEKQVEDIKKQIIERYKPEKIIIFGSYARGNFDKDSNVDFLIIKKDTPECGVERIREVSKLIKRNIAVDFLVYSPYEIEERIKLGDPFIKGILKEGKVIYG